MIRYLRLYAHFLRFSFSRAMEFRLDFFFRIGMDMLWYAMHLVFFGVLFGHTGSLGGWTFDQVLMFAAALFVADALHMTFFSNNQYWFTISVNRGDLDYYLTRPVNSLFFMSLREFAANSFLNLLMALGILVWAIARYPDPLGAARIAVFFVLLLCGALVHFTTYQIFVQCVFWLQSPNAMRNLYHQVSGAWNRPHKIYTGWVRRLLLTVLPFAVMVSVPAEVLIEGLNWGSVLNVLAVLVGSWIFMVWQWRRGLRAYVSASS